MEELKQQAAEHLPPVVKLMAEAVAEGDTKKLFKMMERGELDPNKVLPIFFDLLGKKAEPFMEDYYKTLLYQRRRYAVAEEDWFKSFMSKGGEQGLTHLYDVLASTMENITGTASGFGDIMYRASGALSLIPIAGRDLADWLSGSGRERDNLFRDMLGDMPAIQNLLDFTEVDELKKSFSELASSSTELFRALSPIAGDLAKFGAALTKATALLLVEESSKAVSRTADAVEYVASVASGDTKSSSVKIAAKVATESLVDKILTDKGIDPTTYDWKDKNRMVREVYPFVLEEVSSRRSEMGVVRGALFDFVEGSPLFSRYPPELQGVLDAVVAGVIDIVDVGNLLTGSETGLVGGETTLGKLRFWNRGKRFTDTDLEFLSRYPEAVQTPLETPTGLGFTTQTQQRVVRINEINRRLSEKMGDIPEAAYQSEYGYGDDLLGSINSPRTGYKNQPVLPSVNESTLSSVAREAEEAIRNNLPTSEPTTIVPISGNVGNRIENSITLQSTINVEVADIDEIGEQLSIQLEERDRELAFALTTKLGGGIV